MFDILWGGMHGPSPTSKFGGPSPRQTKSPYTCIHC